MLVRRLSGFVRYLLALHCLSHVRLGRGNQFRPHAAQTARQSDLGETPNQPFGWVPLPRLHSITIIVLKLVVIIMVAFAQGKQRHEKRVARAAACGIRLTPEGMAGRVNQECTVLKHNHFGHAADKKTAERADPAVPERAEQSRQTKTHQHSKQMNMSMLPHHQRVFFQIGYVIEGWLRPKLEQKPADVRMEKSFADVVRIFVVIDMFMMPTMIARP